MTDDFCSDHLSARVDIHTGIWFSFSLCYSYIWIDYKMDPFQGKEGWINWEACLRMGGPYPSMSDSVSSNWPFMDFAHVTSHAVCWYPTVASARYLPVSPKLDPSCLELLVRWFCLLHLSDFVTQTALFACLHVHNVLGCPKWWKKGSWVWWSHGRHGSI